jgi:hypothetical protein
LAWLVVIVSVLGLDADARAQSQVLNFNWPSQRDKDTVIKEIEMTETQIIITIQIRNRGRVPINPRIYPPGHPLSFYLLEKATGRRHYLAGSQGLAIEPEYTLLRPGGSRTFKLFFTRIPLASFSLMEGEPSLRGTTAPGTIFWDFLNIDLAELAKKFKSADRPPPRPDHVWNQPSAPAAKPATPKPAQKKEPLKFIDNPPAKE